MIRKFGQRAAVATVAVALATTGSALFAGTALAEGNNDFNNIGGAGGAGGEASANCLIPIGATIGIVGSGGDVAQCNAVGGAGGTGGTGANY